MMGSEGPAVQADSTWYSERRVVRPTAIVADLTVPVVRAAVVRRLLLGCRCRAEKRAQDACAGDSAPIGISAAAVVAGRGGYCRRKQQARGRR